MSKPSPSEWGKLSAGQSYIPWAVDVARAVFSLGLGENVGALFWYVVERSWGSVKRGREGWSDPAPVQINYADLATLWGVKYQRVYDAKKWLVKARMLIENEGGLWVNKNADQWVRPESGSPLLSPDRLAYAKGGRTRTHKRDQQAPSNVSTLEANVPTLDDDACTYRPNVSAPNVPTLEISRSNVSPHIEDRACDEKEKENSKVVAAKQCAPPPISPLDPPTPDGVLPMPYEDSFINGVTPGNHKPSREEIEPIWNALWKYFNLDDPGARRKLCYEFFQYHQMHSPETWRQAIRRLHDRSTLSIGAIGYIRKIAREIEGGNHRQPALQSHGPVPDELKPQPKPRPERTYAKEIVDFTKKFGLTSASRN